MNSGRDLQFRNLQCELAVVGFPELLDGKHVGHVVRMKLQVTGFCVLKTKILMTGRGKVREEAGRHQTDGIPFLYRSSGETVVFMREDSHPGRVNRSVLLERGLTAAPSPLRFRPHAMQTTLSAFLHFIPQGVNQPPRWGYHFGRPDGA